MKHILKNQNQNKAMAGAGPLPVHGLSLCHDAGLRGRRNRPVPANFAYITQSIPQSAAM